MVVILIMPMQINFAAWVFPGKTGEFMDWTLFQYHIVIIAILLEVRQLRTSQQYYYCK